MIVDRDAWVCQPLRSSRLSNGLIQHFRYYELICHYSTASVFCFLLMAFPLASVGSFPCSVNKPIYESCCLNAGGHPYHLLNSCKDYSLLTNILFSDTAILNYRPRLSISLNMNSSNFVLNSPNGLLSTLRRSVHFRSSLIKTPWSDHLRVILF